MRRLQYLLLLPLAVATLIAQSIIQSATPQPSQHPSGETPAPPPPSPSAPKTSPRDVYAAPLFNTVTRNVVLDVVVSDGEGHPVTGLSRNDFVIREDGAPQETRSFEAVNSGAGAASAPHTILLVDEMNTRFQDMAYARYSVEKLLKQRSAAAGASLDQPTALYVLSNDGLHILKDYTEDASAIDGALRRHKAVLPWRMSGGFYPALERVNISLTALQQIAIANMDNSGHKNIVWISPGFPIFSALDIGADGQKRLFDAIRHLSDQMLKARISIYSVDPRGVEGIINTSNDLAFSAYLTGASRAGDVSFGDLAIQTLAVQTGGHAFFGRNDVDRAIATSIHDGNTYYTLSYAPANHDFKGEFRKVKVSIIDRSGLKVQTRDGYYAIPDGAPVDPKQQLHDLASSLYAPLNYNGIRVPISYCNLTQTPPGVSVRFFVSTSSLTWRPDARGRLQTTVTVAAAGRDKKGNWLQNIVRSYEITLQEGIAPSTERGASVTFELPYAHTGFVRFVIRDDASGRVGSSEITVDAPKHS